MFITIRLINSIFIILTFSVLSTLSVVLPGADTPLFYLVSTSGRSTNNLLPLRINGGAGDFATLTGAGIGPIGELYFIGGKLVVQDPAGSINTYKPYISATLDGSGCTNFGPLGFVQGSSTNKCALFESFQIQSDTENSQLGARLVFNFEGGFFVCGAAQDIWYKVSPIDGPSDCNRIDLYTTPVMTRTYIHSQRLDIRAAYGCNSPNFPNACFPNGLLKCTNILNDNNNCGHCDTICQSGICNGGICTINNVDVTLVGNSSFTSAVNTLSTLPVGTTNAGNENQLIQNIAFNLGTALAGLESQSNVIFLNNSGFKTALNSLINFPLGGDQPAVDQGLANLGHNIAAVLNAFISTT